jgi:glycosyltransferase involved in cell wall biosynthesis
MSPYASVIIPTHDRVATLTAAVASVQRQTVEDIEIIIVGDGPTPDMGKIACRERRHVVPKHQTE